MPKKLFNGTSTSEGKTATYRITDHHTFIPIPVSILPNCMTPIPLPYHDITINVYLRSSEFQAS